ncbi:MAG: CHAD domain-containing protein [Candidatus Limnocylindrales bacterium]
MTDRKPEESNRVSDGSPEARSRARRAAAESKSIELEVKYSIEDARAVARWLDETYPPEPDHPWRTHSITDRYFDTPDRALFAAGYGARLRRTDRRTILTVKSDIEVTGALHRRIELEAPATASLEVGDWPESDGRSRLVEIIGDRPLLERFTVQVKRRDRFISIGGGVLLASVDEGSVEWSGVDAGPIAQFEVEYVRGRRAALVRMARAIDKASIARPESRSKLAIAEGMSAEAARVRADDLFSDAGRKVMRRHLLRLLDREIGTRAGDQLALKQMRVATRRLRATWRVFDDGFRKSVRRSHSDELSVLGRELGQVRDLDVLIASIRDDPALAALADNWWLEREAGFARAIGVLDSKRYARFVADSLELTQTPGKGATKRAARLTVAGTAPSALRDGYARLLEAASSAETSADPTAWHALRIEGRRLRYSLEAFADVLGAAATAELIARVTRMQDHLGAMNDAAVAIEAVTTWLADPDLHFDDGTRGAAQEFVARREANIADLRTTVGAVWAQVSDEAVATLLDQALAPLSPTVEALTQS